MVGKEALLYWLVVWKGTACQLGRDAVAVHLRGMVPETEEVRIVRQLSEVGRACLLGGAACGTGLPSGWRQILPATA